MILTKHRKNKKNQFSIYLRNYLFLDETTKKRSFIDDDKNLNLKLFIDNDLHNSNIDVIFFVIIIEFVVFILFFLFFFFFFFSRFSSSRFSSSFRLRIENDFLFRVEIDFRRNTILSVDAKLSFRRKTRIDRDDDAKTFERTNEDIVHIFIDITLDRALRDVYLERLTSSIKTRQNIYNSANDIFKKFHEIRESIKLTSNDQKILLFIRAFAFSLFHQFSKKQHLTHSRDATSIILSKDDNDRNLRQNLSWDEVKLGCS